MIFFLGGNWEDFAYLTFCTGALKNRLNDWGFRASIFGRRISVACLSKFSEQLSNPHPTVGLLGDVHGT